MNSDTPLFCNPLAPGGDVPPERLYNIPPWYRGNAEIAAKNTQLQGRMLKSGAKRENKQAPFDGWENDESRVK